MVAGAAHGLASSTIRFLLARQQIVIAVLFEKEEIVSIPSDETKHLEVFNLSLLSEEQFKIQLNDIIKKYGRIDFLINNINHNLIDSLSNKCDQNMNDMVSCKANAAMHFIHLVRPYLKNGSKGHIISLQPQQIIAGSTANTAVNHAMQSYCHNLQLELQTIDASLSFFGAAANPFPDSIHHL